MAWNFPKSWIVVLIISLIYLREAFRGHFGPILVISGKLGGWMGFGDHPKTFLQKALFCQVPGPRSQVVSPKSQSQSKLLDNINPFGVVGKYIYHFFFVKYLSLIFSDLKKMIFYWLCPSVGVLAVGFQIIKWVFWEIKILKNAKIVNTFRP